MKNGAWAAQYTGVDRRDFLTLNPDFALVRGDYRVRLANKGNGLYAGANRLVANMYGSRGLNIAGPSFPAGRESGEQVTLVATRGQEVLGTLTLVVDSGVGLHADSLYGPQIDELRMRGCRLCEVTRLAIDPDVSGHEVMATLFNVAFVLAREVFDRTDLVAEVHPRHAGFYRRTMGYRVAGPEQLCTRVRAPAVLMHLRLAFSRSQILQYAGSTDRSDRNLYRLFLPAAEQEVLLERLTLPIARAVNPSAGFVC